MVRPRGAFRDVAVLRKLAGMLPASLDFAETPERQALRAAAADLGRRYGYAHFIEQARNGGRLAELWREAGKLGFLGVNLPERYGGGGAGLYELSVVLEELAAAGCGLLMMVVSPAICGTIIARFGTLAQQENWLPRLASGSAIMAFAITEPDAGSNSHRLATVARRDGDEWVLSGRKIYISGVDEAAAVLVVGRTQDARTGRLRPALFAVPTDAPGFTFTPIEMELVTPERQFLLFLDDVRLPADALIGEPDAALMQLFAGLNPERIMASAMAIGLGRYALDKAVGYVRERQVWDVPIGAHQGVAHPLAQIKIELELAKLMMQKAATLQDAGQDEAAGEAANMAKYAAAEASVRAVDQAVQSLGGNGLTKEYGVASLLAVARTTRVAPVSREMILNFVAQKSLGLPKSY
jgi:alkylation response protein AidB-like acyl-CoA dehydrogenase